MLDTLNSLRILSSINLAAFHFELIGLNYSIFGSRVFRLNDDRSQGIDDK